MTIETILMGVISVIGGAYLKEIFPEIIPDKKKHISLIKKILGFILSFIFPLASIVLLMLYSKVDKWFVLSLVCNFSALIFNFILYILNKILDILKIHREHLSVTKELVADSKEHTDQIKSILGIIENQKNILLKIVANDKPNL